MQEESLEPLSSWIKMDAKNHGLKRPSIMRWVPESSSSTLSAMVDNFEAITCTMSALHLVLPLMCIRFSRVIGTFAATLQHAAMSLDACTIQECLVLSLRIKAVWLPAPS